MTRKDDSPVTWREPKEAFGLALAFSNEMTVLAYSAVTEENNYDAERQKALAAAKELNRFFGDDITPGLPK